MTWGDLSRREMLRRSGAATGLLAVGGLAGCAENLPESLGGSPASTTKVPAGAESIYYTDVDAVLTDEGTKAVANAYIDVLRQSEYYEGPEDYDAALEEFDDETDLDLHGVTTLTGFSRYEETEWGTTTADEYSAAIFEAEWNEDELVDALEAEGAEFDDVEYEGKTVHVPEYGTTRLGVLSEGTYVVGTRDAVEDAIDVEVGERDAVGGELEAAFEDTRAAPIRWASIYPESSVPDRQPSFDEGELNTDVLRDVEYTTGSVYRDGDVRGIETSFRTTDEDAALDVEDLADGSLSLVRGTTESDALKDALRDVSVERDGTTVTVGFERTIEGLTDLIEEFESEVNEQRTGGGSAPAIPQASFSFDYEETGSGEGVVTVTHTAGDAIDAENLQITGFGIVDAEGDADDGPDGLTSDGQWPEAASSDGQVTAGNRVHVGARSDVEMHVVFSDESSSATLAHYTGPDA